MRLVHRLLLYMAALSAALSPALQAQDRRLSATDAGTTQPFRFTAIPSNIRESKATPGDVKAVEAAARRVASLVAEAPALNPPRGFHSLLSATLMGRDSTQARLRPVAPFDFSVTFAAPQKLDDETFALFFWINDLRPVILDHLGVRKWEDARGDFYLEPAQTEEVGGFPMYNDVLVIARPGDSIWAPVPVERFARTLAEELKSGADDAEKSRNRAKTELEVFLSAPAQQKRRAEIDAAGKGPEGASEVRRLESFFAEDEAAVRRKVNPDASQPKDVQWYFGPVNAYMEVQALLAGLDAAGRAAPACVTGVETPERWRTKIVPVGTQGCRRVVEVNLGLFKPDLPRSAIQLITVENINYCRRDVASQKQQMAYGCSAILEVVQQLDWKRVGSLLQQ
jgi:hypothetical protein